MKSVDVAAVDLGATSGRVIVGTWRARRLALTEVHRFPNAFRTLAGGDYWDIPYLWSEVRTGLIKARRQCPKLASVGVDSWAVDHVLVNSAGRLAYPVHAYRDLRTQKLSQALEKNLGLIYRLTGIPNYPYNTSLQLQETLAAFPEISASAARCLFISDYFNFLLSGRMENEFSIASHSQLLDVRGRDWSAEALAWFGIPAHWFGQPALSPRRLGSVKNFPDLRGVQVSLVPGHDTACAFAAMPAAGDGKDLFLSSGTWSLVGFESDRPVQGDAACAARISNERTGDGAYRPLKSCLGLWLLEKILPSFTQRPRNARGWKTLLQAAESSASPAKLLDVADPRLFNPPDMRAAIDQQLRKNRAKVPRDLAGYVRLICDSLAQGHADALDTLQHLSGESFNRLLIVGGGSKNALLCRATARASGLPVVSYSLEGAAVGNLAHQLIALGELKNLADFRGHWREQLRGTRYLPTA